MKSSEILTGKVVVKQPPSVVVESQVDRLNRILEEQRRVRAAHGKK